MSVRIFVPTTLGALERFTEEGGIGPSPIHGHAVTEWLRGEWPEADEEEWSYAALMAAADDSASSLTEDDRPRRVVLVAEVERLTEDRESTAVILDSAISMRLVQAVHADTEDVDPSSPADLGDLGWFAVQEIPELLA
jgi:hypothetical protein